MFFDGFIKPAGGVMLIMLFKILLNIMACLIILRRSRVSHPRVAIWSVVIVWRR